MTQAVAQPHNSQISLQTEFGELIVQSKGF